MHNLKLLIAQNVIFINSLSVSWLLCESSSQYVIQSTCWPVGDWDCELVHQWIVWLPSSRPVKGGTWCYSNTKRATFLHLGLACEAACAAISAASAGSERLEDERFRADFELDCLLVDFIVALQYWQNSMHTHTTVKLCRNTTKQNGSFLLVFYRILRKLIRGLQGAVTEFHPRVTVGLGLRLGLGFRGWTSMTAPVCNT